MVVLRLVSGLLGALQFASSLQVTPRGQANALIRVGLYPLH